MPDWVLNLICIPSRLCPGTGRVYKDLPATEFHALDKCQAFLKLVLTFTGETDNEVGGYGNPGIRFRTS
jgi:hypothetical protein